MINLATTLLQQPIRTVRLEPVEPRVPRSALDVLADALLEAVKDAPVIDQTWARKTSMDLVNRWYREIGR